MWDSLELDLSETEHEALCRYSVSSGGVAAIPGETTSIDVQLFSTRVKMLPQETNSWGITNIKSLL